MQLDRFLILNSILFGFGLAMDAFSVSLVNGLNEPDMKAGKMNLVAGTFSFFQFIMPMIGWVCVHTIVELFTSFDRLVPWIALALLTYIGGEMIIKGMRHSGSLEEEKPAIGFGRLLVQGVATSIDALSVGFTIEHYSLQMALVSSLIIGAVTHFVCLCGIAIGKRFGTRFADKASIAGGIILIAIGIEILIKRII